MSLVVGLFFVFVFFYIVIANINHYCKSSAPSVYSANRSKASQSAQFRNHSPIRSNSPNDVETSIVAAGAATAIAEHMSENEGVFDHGSSTFSSLDSLNASDINPATGLPMVSGTGSVDVAGNPYGTSADDIAPEIENDTSIFEQSDSFDSFDNFDN